MTFSIPDLSDPAKRALLPPSPHKPTAIQLLQGCAELQDPLAVKHLLTAVYLANYTASPLPAAREIASHIPRSAIPTLRKNLEELKIAGQDDPEALTLLGLFLEAENQPAKARKAYETALKVPWVYTYSVQARHPAQLPIPPPWIALGYSLSGSRDQEVKALAKTVFEQGAKKGDDPLACWEYTSYLSKEYEGERKEWLKFVSKAAASGHREAMLSLARFYREIAQAGGKEGGRGLAGSLNWLLGWKKGSEDKLAREWYDAAGKAGQKEALMELAEWCKEEGEGEKAESLLERIVEPVEKCGEEEFPQVVQRARRMLGGVKHSE
jgi:TPR repeat protein